ncbi:MAG: pyrimidine utilization protein D [Stellaceae bacterium]
MPRVSIGDCHLYYERAGSGFPVLLVTGLGGNASHWREQMPVFAKSFDAVTFDHRGIGQSDHDKSPYSVERMATDVIALMDELDIAKAHVVGHSTGGAICQILALDHPQRLASIVIAASWTKADAYFRRLFALRRETLARNGPASYVQAASLFLYPPFYLARNNEKMRQVEAQMLATFSAPEIMLSRIDAILAFDRTADLGRIRTPTMVIAAQDDIVTPAYFSEELSRAIPGAEAKFLAQGGHCFNIVFPREFNHAVLPFLAAHTPAEARRSA